MKRSASVGVWRMLAALLVAFMGGVQLSLYLWDIYDDRAADPLSAAIGLVLLGAAVTVGLLPYFRRS